MAGDELQEGQRMVGVKRIEELLREYAKHLPEERLFSEEVPRQLRDRLRPSSAAKLDDGELQGPDCETRPSGKEHSS